MPPGLPIARPCLTTASTMLQPPVRGRVRKRHHYSLRRTNAGLGEQLFRQAARGRGVSPIRPSPAEFHQNDATGCACPMAPGGADFGPWSTRPTSLLRAHVPACPGSGRAAAVSCRYRPCAAPFARDGSSSEHQFDQNQVQPASIDLRLGEVAYRVRASFLAGPSTKVKARLDELSMHALDLTRGRGA